MGHDYPRKIKTYWSEEYPCSFCGSTTNTGHVESCLNANLYDWKGNAIAAVPNVKEKPTWHVLSVTLQTSDVLDPKKLTFRFNHDLAYALNKVFAEYGITASLFSNIQLEQIRADDVQS